MNNFEKTSTTSNHLHTFNLMLSIVKQHGGKCLSSNFKGEKTHLLWECSDGHQWEAVPTYIQTGSWCPICSKKIRGRKL